MNNNFAYFIASYGKPADMPTLKSLIVHKAKYPIYIVVGTDDPKLEEYRSIFTDNLLIFDKADYIDKIDDIGTYAKTHKVCTYSRLAVEDFAEAMDIQYIGYLFDDIEYFQIRKVEDGKVKSIREFEIDRLMDMYIKLLQSSDNLVLVGPPNSSFYIGINPSMQDKYSTRYGNMFVYDINKRPLIQRSSVLEDMDIVLTNNKIGRMSICPFGLQVCCRAPHITTDAYGNMSKSEYYQHLVLIGQKKVFLDRPIIPYMNFTPKIISDKYRNTQIDTKGGLF